MAKYSKQEEVVLAEQTSVAVNMKSESDCSTKQQVPVSVERNSSETDNCNNILSPVSMIKCEIVEYETPTRDSHSPASDVPPNPNPNNSDTKIMINLPPETILKSEYGKINCIESNITFDKYGHGHSNNNSDSENDNEHDPFADIECGFESLAEQLPQNKNASNNDTNKGLILVSPTPTPSPSLCSSDNNTKFSDEKKLTFLKCPECPYSSSDAHGLKWHLRKHHPSNSISKNTMPLRDKFHCPNPNLINTSESELNKGEGEQPTRHLLYDLPSQQFKCSEPYCKNTFETECHLLQHILSNSSEADPDSNTTDSISTSTLISTYTSKPYKCTQPNCKKSFKTRHCLVQHSASHSDYRPFQCPQQGCTKTYKFRGALHYHRNSRHSDII